VSASALSATLHGVNVHFRGSGQPMGISLRGAHPQRGPLHPPWRGTSLPRRTAGLGKCQASWVTRQCLRGARASGAPLYTAPYRAACMRLFMVSKGYTEAQLSTPAAPPAPPVSAPLGAPAALQHGCDSTGTARRSTQGAHTCMLDHRLAQPADAGVKKHERLHHCAIAPHANG